MNTSWVPSHVQITVHQARDLLLKNKNGHSELYVCLQVEREKIVTSHLPRQSTPAWNHTTDFPLMSLDTTVQLTVRQKGIVSDNFIGCSSIPLSGFTINSKPITHWYKLGAKPGKTNTKLRGELLVTIKFVSKWLSSTSSGDLDVIVTNGDASPRSRKMLKRSKSDQKLKSRDSNSSLLETPQSPQLMQSKIKEKLSAFRRSFRRKNKSPVLDQCTDEFGSYCSPSHSPAITPEFRKRSQTVDLGKRSGSPSYRQAYNCRSRSDSDHSEGSQSPVFMKPSAQALFAEVAALENGVEVEGDVPSEENAGIQQSGEVPVSPAMKFHNFRRKKRPWSMHQLPLTPTPTRSNVIGLTSPSEENEPNENTTHNTNSSGSGSASGSGSSQPDSSTEDGLGVITYRAKSSSLSRSSNIRIRPQSYSFSMNDSQQSVRSFTEPESNSESCSETTTPVCSPSMDHRVRETSSEGLSNPVHRGQNVEGESRLLPLSENGAATSSSEPGRNNVQGNKSVRGVSRSRGDGSRRVVSPVSSKSGSKQRARPKLLSYGNDVSDASSRPATAPALRNGNGGRLASHRLSSTKPIALNTTSPPSADESLSINVNKEVKEGTVNVSQEHVNKGKRDRKLVSRRNTFAGNNLPVYKHEDPKSGIANVRKSLIGDTSPRLRKGVQNSKPQKSPASQRQHNAPAIQKVPGQDGSDPPPEADRSPLLQKGDLRPPKQTLSDRGSVSPSLKPSTNDPRQSLSDRGSASPSLRPSSNDPRQSLSDRGSASPPLKPSSTDPRQSLSDRGSASPPLKPSSTDPRQSLSDRGSASPPLKPSSDVIMRHTSSQSEESPGSATVSRKKSDSSYAPSLSSSVERIEGSAKEAGRVTLPRGIKHTVAYKESSPLSKKSKQAFQPLSLHPPSFTDYRSQTLPTRAKLNRQLPDAGKPLSCTMTSETEAQNSGTDYDRSPPKRNPENILLVKRGSMNFAGSPSSSADTQTAAGQSPSSNGKRDPSTQAHRSSNPSYDDTDSATNLKKEKHSTAPPSFTRPQSATSTSPSMSPGKIVASAMRNRKPSGGLKKAMSMYQENKRQLTRVQRGKNSLTGSGYGMHGVGGAEKQRLHVSQMDARVTVSAGNSPTLQRRSTYMETLWRKNPFGNLRRTKSHLSPNAPNARPLSMGDLDALTSDMQGGGFLKSQSAQSTPAPNVARSSHGSVEFSQGVPGLLQTRVESSWTYSVADCNSTVTLTPQSTSTPHSSSTQSEGRNTLPRPSSPLSESSSISTLTKSDTNLGQRWESDPPDPVGASYGHQTCSSVESEGFGSYTSEELTLDDLVHQDWGQWAKEDLVKELIHTKQRLSSAEDELKAVKSYLDNLLLRIMETNPSLLSSTQ